VIECGDEDMFWKVDNNYSLTATRNPKQASVFHIVACDEMDDTDNFNIGWQGQTLEDIERQGSPITPAKIMRYLEVKTYYYGHCCGPLKFKSHLSSQDSRLCLYGQMTSGYFDSPEDDLVPWTKKKKVFFISSTACRSFVAVARYRNTSQSDPTHNDAYRYTTKCVGSQNVHDEKDAWMLFRLLPTEQKTEKVSITERSKRRLNQKFTELFETS
jgi:hypothetical protein